jgi:hypothetical protein
MNNFDLTLECNACHRVVGRIYKIDTEDSAAYIGINAIAAMREHEKECGRKTED